MLILVHAPRCAGSTAVSRYLAAAAPVRENVLCVCSRSCMPQRFLGVVVLDNAMVHNAHDYQAWVRCMEMDRKVLVVLRPAALEPGVGVKELPGFDSVFTITDMGDLETLAKTLFDEGT